MNTDGHDDSLTICFAEREVTARFVQGGW